MLVNTNSMPYIKKKQLFVKKKPCICSNRRYINRILPLAPKGFFFITKFY